MERSYSLITMTTPTWFTICGSRSPTGNILRCNLPLIGLTGQITNSTPSLQKANDITRRDSCDAPIRSPNCSPEYGDTCAKLQCPDGQLGGFCVCKTTSTGTCRQFSCDVNYECTRECLVLNKDQTCPNADSIHIDQARPPTRPTFGYRAQCTYTIDPNNINDDKMTTIGSIPNFGNDMIKRYIMHLYLQEWSKELYNDPKGESNLHTFPYPMSSDDLAGIQQFVLSDARSQSNFRYSRFITDDVTKYLTFVSSTTSFPTFSYTAPDNYTVFLYVYNTLDAGDPNLAASQLSTLLQGGLGELPSEGIVSPQVSASSAKFTITPTLEQLRSNKYYIFADLENNNVYNNKVSSESELVTMDSITTTGDYYVMGRVYPVKVQKWSPTLAYLFDLSNKGNLPYGTLGGTTPGLCDVIRKDTNLITNRCYQGVCGADNFSGNVDECKNFIETLCPRSRLYVPNYPGVSSSVENYLFGYGTGSCLCYGTQLMPPNQQTPNDARIGMCFTSSCQNDPEIIKAFNLSDDFCKDQCDTVTEWLTSRDPATRSSDPTELDVAKYVKLCGDRIPGRPLVNYIVLAVGVTLAIVTFLVLYFEYRPGGKPNLAVAITVFIVMLFIGIFLSYDLNGLAGCDNNVPTCKTAITGINLPQSWCPLVLGCECFNYGTRCGTEGNKICVAGVCVDDNGSNNAIKNTFTLPKNFWILIGIGILGAIIITILAYRYKKRV